MNKWHGRIGFSIQEETDPVNSPSVYENVVKEKEYYGDILRNIRRRQSSEYLNDNRAITLSISIIADPYVTDHIGDILYVTWLGKKWKVNDREYEYPRITLSIGDLYNEQSS